MKEEKEELKKEVEEEEEMAVRKDLLSAIRSFDYHNLNLVWTREDNQLPSKESGYLSLSLILSLSLPPSLSISLSLS